MAGKLLAILLIISANSFGQVYVDSVYYEYYGGVNEFEYYEPKTKFIGLHSHISAEFIPVNTKLFETLLSDVGVAAVDLSPVFELASLSFMRNWMFTSLSLSLSEPKEQAQDSLVSRLTQSSVVARFGYNLIRNQSVAVSPYVGLRYSRFRHITSLKGRDISIDDYLLVRDIDLRVSQYTGELGFSTTISLKKMWSVGFYASYLIHFSKNPTIWTRFGNINEKISNPLNNFVFGIGFGFGGFGYLQ